MILNMLFQIMALSVVGITGILFFMVDEQLVFASSYFVVVFSITVILIIHRYDLLKFLETRFGYSKDCLEILEDRFVIPEMYFIKKSISREKIMIPLTHVSEIHYHDLNYELQINFKYDFQNQSLVLKRDFFYKDIEEFEEIINYFKFHTS